MAADLTPLTDAIARTKIACGYRLRVKRLTGGLMFAFLQSPGGSTSHTHVVPLAMAQGFIADGTVTHRRTTRYGAEVYTAKDAEPTPIRTERS